MDHQGTGLRRIRPSWIVLAGLAVLGLLAVGVPLANLLYVGVLLLCPLLMAGMHGGQSGHGQHDDHGEPSMDHEAHGAHGDGRGAVATDDPPRSNAERSVPPTEGTWG